MVGEYVMDVWHVCGVCMLYVCSVCMVCVFGVCIMCVFMCVYGGPLRLTQTGADLGFGKGGGAKHITGSLDSPGCDVTSRA